MNVSRKLCWAALALLVIASTVTSAAVSATRASDVHARSTALVDGRFPNGTRFVTSIPPRKKKKKLMRNVLYFPSWDTYRREFKADDIPAKHVTHLLYAFATLKETGEVYPWDLWADVKRRPLNLNESHVKADSNNLYGAAQQFYLVKKKHRHVKTLVSIGGWDVSQSGAFEMAASTKQSRKLFANSAVKLLADWGFDGIDIDWEYPKDEQDAKNFVLLLKACRKALSKYSRLNRQLHHYLLTIAASAGPKYYRIQNLGEMDKYIDQWHLMAYDYAGSWDEETGSQSNVYPDPDNMVSTKFNTDQAIEDYISKGIAPHKIVMGLPLYGRSFLNTEGLGKPYSGVGIGSVEKGIWLYRHLPRPGANVYVNNRTISAHTYDENSKELVTFDNTETTKLKATYLMGKGLGGTVFWEASGDHDDERSLVRTMSESMGKLDRSKNMLKYPVSIYENVRRGMPKSDFNNDDPHSDSDLDAESQSEEAFQAEVPPF
ncbi:Chitinase 1 [Cladobotryum mycophilum]|uniref:chitinase n=1 Tax=Cladobotryum mycophilum TaxID=491253 RepID=A0ABR0SFL3_9HYPO